ncbi:5-formyltetrahydrofolate cyclo-ligase [bacterium]|nr:MAG: 5-formyltetrahydrofolate cyclo-ligase [bacterium]
MLNKVRIRTKMLLKLRIQKEEDRNRKSSIIKRKLFNTAIFKKAKNVMFYISFDGEVDTQNMIKEAQKLGKIVTVPVCRKNRNMKACLLKDGVRLKKGLYGTQEPAVKDYLSVDSLDLVLVPGVAFDKKGARLGRGKGFYDRFLAKLPAKATSIGLAFRQQILPAIPSTVNDTRVHKLIFA